MNTEFHQVDPFGSASRRVAGSLAHIVGGVDMSQLLDRLYGLDPAEFTSARDASAGEARRAGDRATADAIKALHRPAPAAWAVNLLVREHTDELHALLDLGARLREAQASLSADDLRQLSRQRQEVVAGLARQALALAAGRGRPISDAGSRQVEETLVAALADPDAAAAVASGRLERTLDYSGFGPVDLEQAVAGPPPTAPPPAPPPAPPAKKTAPKRAARKASTARSENDGPGSDGPDPQLVAAEAEVARAGSEVDQARAELTAARSAVETAEDEQAEVEAEVARLEEQLGAARRELVAAKGRTRAAARTSDAAAKALTALEGQAAAAAKNLEKRRARPT